MKKILIATILTIFLTANSLEDMAFVAYKNHQFNKAFNLYKEAAKNKSLKAIFMLGLFYEKGVGVEKNIQKAIKIYKIILKQIDVKKLKESSDKKSISVAIMALKRLYFITNDEKYIKVATRLENILYK